MPMIGKAMKGNKKVFCRINPDGSRTEIKKTKDGWVDVGPIPNKTDVEKQKDKLGLQIKAAEMKGDNERLKELKEKLDELS